MGFSVAKIVGAIALMITFARADIVSDVYVFHNRCVDDYYYEGRYMHFHDIANDRWYSSRSYDEPLRGYIYDTDTQQCKKFMRFGLFANEYNFLMALSGVLSGFAFLIVLLFLFKGS